jgi:hypothetical protein
MQQKNIMDLLGQLVESLNGTARNAIGAGTQTAALVMVDLNHLYYLQVQTEEYNGTTWTSISTIGTARYNMGCRNSNCSFSFGGYDTANYSATEEYNDYGQPNTFQNIGQVWYNGTTKALKFTDETFSSAWATGGNLGYSKNYSSRSRNSNCRFSFWW